MIVDIYGEKCTPKAKARQILAEAMHTAAEYLGEMAWADVSECTPSEREKIRAMMTADIERIEKQWAKWL